jgi:hypothetical protein
MPTPFWAGLARSCRTNPAENGVGPVRIGPTVATRHHPLGSRPTPMPAQLEGVYAHRPVEGWPTGP